MNVYQVNIEQKAVGGSGLTSGPVGPYGGGRTIHVVTGTLQEAMSIARTKITDKEYIQGVWETAKDVVVDYSQQQSGQN